MRKYINQNVLTFFIGTVWMVNGLFCKVLNFVPRHQEIVARILGNEHAEVLTKMIGFSEIIMALWIFIGVKANLNTILQIAIIAIMNILEFILAPDLLLWGRFNALFAFLFILLIWFNEFQHKNKFQQT